MRFCRSSLHRLPPCRYPPRCRPSRTRPIRPRLPARFRRATTVCDFTADFTHTYTGGVLKKQVVERGTIQVKKPGRMRWRYANPEEKTVRVRRASDLFLVPADRQVIVSPMPAEDRATTAALFLTGKETWRGTSRRNRPRAAGAPPGSVAIELTPRQEQRDTIPSPSWSIGRPTRSACWRRMTARGAVRRSRSPTSRRTPV